MADRPESMWKSTIEDAGNGDGFIPLPDALLELLGWHVGDDLEVKAARAGEIVLSKAINSSPTS